MGVSFLGDEEEAVNLSSIVDYVETCLGLLCLVVIIWEVYDVWGNRH